MSRAAPAFRHPLDPTVAAELDTTLARLDERLMATERSSERLQLLAQHHRNHLERLDTLLSEP